MHIRQPYCSLTTRNVFQSSRKGYKRLFSTSINSLILDHDHCLLTSRRLIEVRGPQASQFLQGLTTANITASLGLSGPRSIYSAFLNAQGRLLQDVFIYAGQSQSDLNLPAPEKYADSKDQDCYLIDVDASQHQNLLSLLKKYKLRSKVLIRDIPSDLAAVYTSWPDSSKEEHNADMRVPDFAIRTVIPITKASESTVNDRSSQKAFQIWRYLHGIPEGQEELPYSSALIHDSNIDLMGGVDFRKGCYVGQELVIRTQHTGVVRKRILPCVVYHADQQIPSKLEYDQETRFTLPPNGADIKNVVDEGRKARSKGKWISGVGNIGLALCRLEDMVGIGPAGDDIEGYEQKEWGFEWEVQSDQDKQLRIKAFVPDWWRNRIRKVKPSEHGKGI